MGAGQPQAARGREQEEVEVHAKVLAQGRLLPGAARAPFDLGSPAWRGRHCTPHAAECLCAQEAADDDQGTTEKLEILERDFSAPTGEDKWINKELLPKVMQVRES